MFLLLTFQHNLNRMLNPIFFMIFSLPVPVAGYEPSILGLWVECSTTEHNLPLSISLPNERGGGYSNRWSSNFQSPSTGPSTPDPQPPTSDPGSPTLDPRPPTSDLWSPIPDPGPQFPTPTPNIAVPISV